MSKTKTPLDHALETLATDPDNTRLRLHVFGRLAETELFVLLAGEADGNNIEPELASFDGLNYLQVFDLEERLADHAGAVAHYAAATGRALAQMIEAQELGLMLNPRGENAGFLVDPQAVTWLAQVLDKNIDTVEQAPATVMAPMELPFAAMTALNERLARVQGLAKRAHLASLAYDDGTRRNVLALIDPAPGSEATLTDAISEALMFAGAEPDTLDIAFLRNEQPSAAKFRKMGVQFDIPEAEKAATPSLAPGMDPDKPPRLH